MKDIELSNLFGIPYSTIADWKKRSATDWRAKLYTYLSLKTPEEVEPEIDRIEKILQTRKEK